MSEQLNTALVQQKIKEHGWKMKWVIDQIGLKRTAGHYLIRDGMLPKDAQTRKSALEKLAKLLGLEVPQILLRPDWPKTA